MSLFDDQSPKTLADALGYQADSAIMGIQDQYAKKRRQNASQQAHLGRLGSGVSNYQTGDLAASELGDIGGVQSSLASALSGIPTNDYLGQQDFNRNKQLAEYIASLQQPSTLEEVFGGIGTAARLGGTAAAFF